jgi:hypothetical protein
MIEKIRLFAIEQHHKVNQLYDNLPYSVHLIDVNKFVDKFKYLLTDEEYKTAKCVAWCHDILEDTNITYNELCKQTSKEIAENVYLLTNNKGRNRKERANEDYYNGIKTSKIAIYVKLCDRISNTVYSIYKGDNKRYDSELPLFKSHLFDSFFIDMWNFLEQIKNVELEEIYTHIVKFDKDTIENINLPKLIGYNTYIELYNKGIIRKSQLLKNHYYYGTCRNANVALWNGYEFLYNRTKFGSTYVETINHLEDDNGYDLFIPLRITEPKEEQKIKF